MLTLRIIVIIACVAFVFFVAKQVVSRKLLLKYSLLWLVLALITFLCALFPEPIYWLSGVLGFDVPSNFIFFGALFFLLAICLSLSVVVSKQSMRIKNLVQTLAMHDNQLEELKNTTKSRDNEGE